MNDIEKAGGRRVTGEQERRIKSAVKKGQDAALKARRQREELAGRCSRTSLLAGSVSNRVAELENAIVNIYRWTGGKKVARECLRVLPDAHERLSEQKKQDQC